MQDKRGLYDPRQRPRRPARPTGVSPVAHLALADIVRLDMCRYGAGLIRAEFAGGAVLTAALTLVLLAIVVTHRQMVLAGQFLLLGLGIFFAGGFLNCLTLLIIACLQDAGRATLDDPELTHRAILRLTKLLLIPGSLPLLALRQDRRNDP